MTQINGTVNAEIKAGKLIITVDVSPEALKHAPLSKSGKSRIVGSTSGFVRVGDVKIGLNVITAE